jgi:hypothetical protein
MVKIIGYYVVFKGHPETRRAPLRISVEMGIAAMQQFIAKQPVLIKGSAYANSSIDSIEKITAHGLDVDRAVKAGQTVVSEEQLKQMLAGPTQNPALPQGDSTGQLNP